MLDNVDDLPPTAGSTQGGQPDLPALAGEPSNLFRQSCHLFTQQGLADPFQEAANLLDLLSAVGLEEKGWPDSFLAPPGLEEVARKRKEGVPLEYIVERAAFMGRIFHCNPATLIPRKETELLVKAALALTGENRPSAGELAIIDMGTGCGNIAISLALNSNGTHLLASDISPAAVEVARKNIEQFKLQARVRLFCGDLFGPFHTPAYLGQIDLIVCNPPYIPTGSLSKLGPGITDHEPLVALQAGTFGLDFFQKLINRAPAVLKPHGTLVFEIGAGQAELIGRLLRRNKRYDDMRYYRDETGAVRVVSARTRDGKAEVPQL